MSQDAPNEIDKAAGVIGDISRAMDDAMDAEDMSRDDLFHLVAEWSVKLWQTAESIK